MTTRNKDFKVGDFVKCSRAEDSKGFIVDIVSRGSLPLMATVLWSDGTSTTRWQDDLTLVRGQQYLIS